MNTSLSKYCYCALLVITFFAMIRMSLDAGISGDELVHKQHATKVVDYFSSAGKDKAALHTPKTNLKYYGQGFDNFMELLSRAFKIDDIITLRHVGSVTAGWLTILFASLIALVLGGHHAAIVTILALFLAPRFLGHSFNNLKDIPFALGYTAFAYYLIRYIREFSSVKIYTIIGLIVSIAFTISIRAGGLILIGYLFLAIALMLLLHPKQFKLHFFNLILIVTGGYFAGLLFWPYALVNPIVNPIKSLFIMSDYPVTIRQLFEGKIYWSDQLPWYYLPKYIAITTPLSVLLGMVLSFTFFIKRDQTEKRIIAILFFMILFPLSFVIIKSSNVYGGWRHLLFIYPLIAVLCGLGYKYLFSKSKFITWGIIAALFLHPTLFIIRNHPYQYLYFNQFVGGWNNAYGNYEGDYYFHSVTEACNWIKKHNANSPTTIASNFWIDWDFRNYKNIKTEHISFYERGKKQWDYAIMGNTFIQPKQIKQGIWPPANTVHRVLVDNRPICIVLKRKTTEDYLGYQEYNQQNYQQAIQYFENATKQDSCNSHVWLTLGKSYKAINQTEKARKCIEKSLRFYHDYEPALVQLALLKAENGQISHAIDLLKQVINKNSKYLSAYIELVKLYIEQGETSKAKLWLLQCDKVYPNYKPAQQLKQETQYNIE